MKILFLQEPIQRGVNVKFLFTQHAINFHWKVQWNLLKLKRNSSIITNKLSWGSNLPQIQSKGKTKLEENWWIRTQRLCKSPWLDCFWLRLVKRKNWTKTTYKNNKLSLCNYHLTWLWLKKDKCPLNADISLPGPLKRGQVCPKIMYTSISQIRYW